MKQLIGMGIISILVLSLVGIVVGEAGPYVGLSLLKYSPTPAEPGSTVDVWIQATARAVPAEGVVIKLKEEYPFSIPQGQESEIAIDRINSGESAVRKYTILVERTSPNGDRQVSFLYKQKSMGEWVQVSFPLSIKSRSATVAIDSYDTVPSPIVPGQPFQLVLNVKNIGSLDVNSVDALLLLNGSQFSTVNTSAKKRVQHLSPGEVATLSYPLAAHSSADLKIHNIPITLGYEDDKKTVFGETQIIGFMVNAPPILDSSIAESDFSSVNAPASVTLKVVNKGLADAKLSSVQLLSSTDYEILSQSDTVYLGGVDSDDYETATFRIKPLVQAPTLQVRITFQDPYNKEYDEKEHLSLKMVNVPRSGGAWWFIIVAIIIGGVVWYRRSRRRHA